LTGGAIFFGGGLPDPSTYPAEALARHLTGVLHEEAGPALTYETGPGVPALRAAVAEQMSRRDAARYDADQVSITSGSAGGILLVALAFLEPDDVVFVEEFTYPGAVKTFRRFGANIVACPVDAAGLVPDRLAPLLARCVAGGRRPKAIYFGANFANPVGGYLPVDRREALAELAIEHEMILVQDDTYGSIRFSESIPPSMLCFAPDHAIELGSFSKTVAPGLRLGWTASSERMAAALTATRTDLGVSPVLQRALGRYLASGEFDTHLTEIRAHYQCKRDTLAEALARHCSEHATWKVPDGGFFVWLSLAHGSGDALLETARRHDVAFLPQSYFSASSLDGRCLRLAYGERDMPELDEGARRLGLAMEDRG
jgi:DNA-binding transcriptional MocR family regulator